MKVSKYKTIQQRVPIIRETSDSKRTGIYMTKPYEHTILSSIQTTPRLIQSLSTQYCHSLIIHKSTITPYDCHFFNLYDPDRLMVTQQWTKYAAALVLTLDPVELFSSLNTKYPESKTIPKWLVDQIMGAI